jgi:hypothetical protein
MNNRFTPSINDLSGALTLPLISRLFAEYQSIEKMDVLLQMLTVLFRCGHTAQAFDIICALFQTSGLTLPQEFYSGIKTDLDKHKFVGEFLTDFQEILDELHI